MLRCAFKWLKRESDQCPWQLPHVMEDVVQGPACTCNARLGWSWKHALAFPEDVPKTLNPEP